MASPINIASLDINDIKTSLVNYLKQQKNFNSYNFDSTALSTLINVLAYNTMFYGYYANVIANESFLETAQIPDNILASIQPLGYVINGVNASKATLNLTGNDVVIEPYTSASFIGTNTVGNNFYFYTIKPYILNSTIPTEVVVYEGNSVQTKTISGPAVTGTDKLDLELQAYRVGGFDIDINTLSVRVDGEYWNLYNPYASVAKITTSDKVYFVERRSNGFYLIFSKPGVDETFGFPGARTIGIDNTVEISYIIPTGQNANGCSIVNAPGTIISSSLSSGGGIPDIDIIKTFAPKLFASSDRAVTKDDYYGVILNSGLIPDTITKPEQILVFGGEEFDPPIPGKVYYSLADLSQTPEQNIALTNYLKTKGIISISPEFVPAKLIVINSTFRYKGPQPTSIIRIALENYFNGTSNENLTFNRSFLLNDFVIYTTNNFSKTQELDIISTTAEMSINSFNNIINFNNSLIIPSSTSRYGDALTSGTFLFQYNDSTGTPVTETVSFKDRLLSDAVGEIFLVNSANQPLFNAGTINYDTGIIVIRKEYLTESGITITLKPRNIKNLAYYLNNIFYLRANVIK